MSTKAEWGPGDSEISGLMHSVCWSQLGAKFRVHLCTCTKPAINSSPRFQNILIELRFNWIWKPDQRSKLHWPITQIAGNVWNLFQILWLDIIFTLHLLHLMPLLARAPVSPMSWSPTNCLSKSFDKDGEETSFWKWLLTQEKSECYQLFWAKHADGSKLLKQSFEKNLGKENKSLLHFQRIASHLENMNWEEANKSVDHMQRSQEYDGERFIALQDAEKLSKLSKSVQIESHNIKERRKGWRQKWM